MYNIIRHSQFSKRQKRRDEAKRLKALDELDDLKDDLEELFKETSKSRCGFESAMYVVNQQIETIREGIRT